MQLLSLNSATVSTIIFISKDINNTMTACYFRGLLIFNFKTSQV